jgi:hypothetical protein
MNNEPVPGERRGVERAGEEVLFDTDPSGGMAPNSTSPTKRSRYQEGTKVIRFNLTLPDERPAKSR